jgi:Ser/Thr protein kinase RdoA (MazF antagonist)
VTSRRSATARKQLALLEQQPESRDHELLRRTLALPVARGQALHGDAALGNCLGRGLWLDFELTGRGPREADLATMLLRDRVHSARSDWREAAAAYGPHDDGLLDHYLRLFTALTCVLLIARRRARPELEPLLAARLDWLARSSEPPAL